ncbi:hydrolase [Chryseobacterium lathyri]|uniref:Nicotinamidase-related amidase n=1 Tax=Chryseobacterium lathyri TaxID=395933 RepID=A0ABT9SRW6_9FLAO|nr:hydrolase [Chryseobacterium lathyri]MDP9961993.1 nicotinamidase-related amidase [Chryseobacterium lathyri]MDQ0064190.1 nicotinamidase-related amidase [Chryseobacterium lathyri]
MNTENNTKAGLNALLTPDNCALILIDHQPFQFAGLRSHDTQTIINNVVGLTKSAKTFGVPTLFTTVLEERGGLLIKQLQDVFPDQKPINRTFINTWEDSRVVDWVKATGKKKIVMAALWTEICLAMPVIQALGEGYEVYIVTDASGGVSLEAHEMAIMRMVQAGAVPITWTVFGSELQRDWARTETVPALGEMLVEHMGNVGTSLTWELQLLATPVPTV